MKKTFSKALSLLLVLAMVVGVMPMALAASEGSVRIAPDDAILSLEDASVTTGVAVKAITAPDNYANPSYEWSGTGVSGSQDSATFTATTAGTYTVSLVVTWTKVEGAAAETDPATKTASHEALIKVQDAPTTNVTVTPTTASLKAGEFVNLTATTEPAGRSVSWNSSDATVATVSNGRVTGVKAGTATITATSGNKSATCVVTVTAVEPSSIAITGAKDIVIGQELPLGIDTQTGVDKSKITWKSSSDAIATVTADGLVKGVDDGEVTITAIYTKADSTEIKDTKTIKVTEGTPVIKPIGEQQVKKGSYTTVYPELSFKPNSLGSTAPQFKAEISTGDPVESDIVKITTATGTSFRFYGKAAGKETIKVTCTNVTTVAPIYFDIYVPAGDVTCTPQSTTAYSGAKVTLTPSYSASNTVDKYTFEIVKQTGNNTITKSVATNNMSCTFTLSGKYPAAAQVQIKAYDGETLVGECVSYVSFYLNNEVRVEMPEGAKTMSFGYASDNKNGIHVADEMLDGLVNATGSNIVSGYNVLISGLDTVEGTLSNTNHASTITSTSLPKTVFTAGTYGSAAFYYTVVPSADYGDMPLIRGYMEIDYDGNSDGDITYSTTYNKSVTFLERDFNEFWKNYWEERNDRYYSDLEFVTFRSPSDGTLYTSTTSTSSSYKATISDQFYYGTYTKGNNKEDLGSLTFVPDSKKTYEYDVTIPFTAYGTESQESVTGVVVIHMNESGNEITSRGTYIGTTYAKQIAEDYKTAKGQNLSYVIFDVPDVEKVSLFFRVPTGSDGKGSLISKGEKVPYNQKLYYSTSNYTNDALSYVIVVPAAEYYGKITLKYTAYDSNGKNPYDGTLTYTVKQKTESDVFADMTRSYNWAYDSVDFLYYDEISQGSVKGYNRYYNPSANITRGDFMLMLYRAFLAEDYSDYNVKDNFNDMVKGNTEYSQETYHAVGVAKYLGISNGTNGKYNPKANITREEAMTLIYRTLEEMNRELEYDSNVSASSFKDYNKISAYAKTAISNLVDHGIIVGNNNNVNPKNNITRAEMACILHRVITY